MKHLAPSLLLLAWMLGPTAAVQAELPSAAVAFQQAGFSDDELKRVLAGEFVARDLEPTSDREIAVAIAYLVDLPPAEVSKRLDSRLLERVDPNTIAFGVIEGDGTLDDFSGIELTPDSKTRAELYRNAKPGDALNLSQREIQTFRSHEKAPLDALQEQVRRTLQTRYRAYRSKGLDGIAPFERSDGKTFDPAAELRRASEAARHLEKHAPNFYKLLLGETQTAPGLDEYYEWSNYDANGTPIFILTHRFAMMDGDAALTAQRQYYVSRSYNVEQSIALFLPVKEGTLVLYENRTSTDQVGGFGGSAKRRIGSKLMAKSLEELFEKVRADVQKSEKKSN